MTDATERRFRGELGNFLRVALLNVVFGALAVGLGAWYVTASVLDATGALPTPALRMAAGALALAAFGLGLAWLRSSARILRGAAAIRRELGGHARPVPEEVLTDGIVRMIAQYRENRKTIRTMVRVCTAGGFCLLALGIVSALESASIALSEGTVTFGSALLPSTLVALGAGLTSLYSSYYFSRFSRVWDRRLAETVRGEERLRDVMGTGRI